MNTIPDLSGMSGMISYGIKGLVTEFFYSDKILEILKLNEFPLLPFKKNNYCSRLKELLMYSFFVFF